jgi:alkylation response protein AidB-like acyl-CoA dehydrogenase
VIDLDLTDEQHAVAELTRDLGLSVLSPAARAAEAAGALPVGVASALRDTGLTTPVAEEHGGGGIPDAVTHILAVEGLAYGDPGLAMAAVWRGGAALLIGLCGTDEQQAAYLPAMVDDATRRSAVALYEGFGRAPSELATTITERADGSWHVAGRKVGVSSAAGADPLIVIGRDANDGRLRAAIVSTAGAGVNVETVARNLALDAAALGPLSIDSEVSGERLLGGAAADPVALGRAVGRLRLTVAAAALGTAQRAVDYASNYATERVAFGRPIAAFQGVSFMMAEALTRITAARLEVQEAAARIDGSTDGTERAVTLAMNYAGVVATQSTRDAVQVLGGHGFITDHPVELWYRSAAALSALDFDPLCSSFEPVL